MNLSVVIITYKTPGLLRQCLLSLQRETQDVTIRDIIVIDNASRDNTLELLRKEFPRVKRIASTTNVGFAKGVNWGLANARAEDVLILNPDIVAEPGALRTLVQALHADPSVGLIAPQLRFPDGSLQDSCLRWQTPLVIACRRTALGNTRLGQRVLNHFLMKDYDHTTPRDVDWVIGGCMLVRRRALEQVGGMDERFFLYLEDTDWCRRFWQAGWRVRYEPRAVVIHHYRRLSAATPGLRGLTNPLARVHLVSGIKYFTKHLGNGRALAAAQAKYRRAF